MHSSPLALRTPVDSSAADYSVHESTPYSFHDPSAPKLVETEYSYTSDFATPAFHSLDELSPSVVPFDLFHISSHSPFTSY